MGDTLASILNSRLRAPTTSSGGAAGFAPASAVSALLEGPEGIAPLLSAGRRAELQALAKEADPQLFAQELFSFASRLESEQGVEAAARIYAALAGAAGPGLEALQAKAQNRLDAILGRGAFGGRAEFLFRRLAKDATDPKTIVPMIAGSAVYGLARTATLGRLLAGSRGAWYAGGLGARLSAASIGFAAEVPTFVLVSRTLRRLGAEGPSPEPGLGQEFSSAALTLGLLKAFSYAGQQGLAKFHGVNELGVATRFAGIRKLSQPIFSQGSLFAGLLAAHRAETGLGLRPQVDGATMVTDTLGAMLSLGAGGRIGEALLGPRFAAHQSGLDLRSQLALRRAEPETARPLPALAKLPRQSLVPWLARLGGAATLLSERLAFAQDASGSNSSSGIDATAMTWISTAVVGGLLLWGAKKIRDNYVAPRGRIAELQGFQARAAEAKPEALLVQARQALRYLQELKGYRRLNEEAIAVEAYRFLGSALPRLRPQDRLPIFQKLWDQVFEVGTHNAHLSLRVLREIAPHLDAVERKALVAEGTRGLNFKDLDQALNSLFLLTLLAPRLEPGERNPMVETLRGALAARETAISEHLQWLQKSRAQLKDLKDFMDQRLAAQKLELRQKIRELQRRPDGQGELVDLAKGRQVELLEQQLKDLKDDSDADILVEFQKHLAEKGEPVAYLDPHLGMDYGDKLQEMFQEGDAAPAAPGPPLGFRARLQYLEPYLKDGVVWIRRLEPRSLLREISGQQP
ncbi:MAG: hypothetical protein U1F66_06520 [bacterium]